MALSLLRGHQTVNRNFSIRERDVVTACVGCRSTVEVNATKISLGASP